MEEKKSNIPETILELPSVPVYDDCMGGLWKNAKVSFHKGSLLSIKFEHDDEATMAVYWSVHSMAECFIEFMLGKYCYHFIVPETIIHSLMRHDPGFECRPNIQVQYSSALPTITAG